MRIWIRDEQPRSYFWEFRNKILELKYLNSLMGIAEPGSGMEKFWIRDPWCKKIASRIRDKHSGSAILAGTVQDSLFCFKDPTRGFGEFPCTQILNNAEFGWILESTGPAAPPPSRPTFALPCSVADPYIYPGSRISILPRSRTQVPDPTKAAREGRGETGGGN